MRKHRKGMELSISMLVIIALAVFVVFLVLGFVTGGWSYFAGAFGKATKGTGGTEAARIRCGQACNSWMTAGCPPAPNVLQVNVMKDRNDMDIGGDGVIDATDKYSCLGAAPVMRNSECSC